MRIRIVLLACVGVTVLAPTPASAQDLFELEVFKFETAATGAYEAAVHTNGLRGPVLSSGASTHRPLHLSLEVARGWSKRVETAVFVQTAPFGGSNVAAFAGGHVRSKVRLTEGASLPFRVALGAEYTFNRPAFDDALQTIEIKPIFDRADGRLSLILNPAVEVVTKGSYGRSRSAFDVAARVGWTLTPAVAVYADYFSRPGDTRHLEPQDEAHHLIFPGLDLAMPGDWNLSLAAGHCATGDEPWVIRSVLGFGFGN